ncbi:MAG: HlyD family efflux transporter periplasmic adaptor subunit [Crocinitomicaceae bacterium]|nr:HlyD family efflux transporter periplasmic adaptor subunit [Crocinitomicaceae bacterium]
MKNLTGIILIVAVIVCNGIIWILVKPKQTTSTVQKNDKVTSIECIQASFQERNIPFSSPAYQEPNYTSNIIFEVSGNLTVGDKEWQVGQTFKANDLLCVLSSDAAYYMLTEKKQLLISDFGDVFSQIENRFPQEKAKWYAFLEKITPSTKIPSLPNFSSNEERIFMAELGLMASYYAIKTLENNMKNYFYTAPFDGKIIAVNYQLGAYIEKGKTIATLVKESTPEFVVYVETKHVNKYVSAKEINLKSNETFYGKATFTKIGQADIKTPEITPLYYKMAKKENGIIPLNVMAYLNEKEKITGYMLPNNAVSGNKVCLLSNGMIQHKTIKIIREINDSILVTGITKQDVIASKFIVITGSPNKKFNVIKHN